MNVDLYLNALFHGKLNVPEAAQRAGLSTETMKDMLTAYTKATPTEDWELDVTPCWPYR